MINYKEITDGESWELFTRDFLNDLGFLIENPPSRGADGGKDLIVTEIIKGKIHQSEFRWLVSCKNYAISNKSVNENDDEKNILERVKSYKADGFMGFYSTIASSGLGSRLSELKKLKEIKDFQIFDGKRIENYLTTVGYSHLLIRYFPESYKIIKPLELVLEKYQPLLCKECGKDLLIELYKSEHNANIVYVYKRDSQKMMYEEIYCCCKKCDRKIRNKIYNRDYTTSWRDMSDIIIPLEFLNYMFATMNRIKDGDDSYTDKAYRQEQNILMALSQKVLRSTTIKERKRLQYLAGLF